MTINSDPKKVHIAFIGDSITFGYPFGMEFSWVNLLQRKMGNIIYTINLGENGSSIVDMCGRLKRNAASCGASYVHILGGANDAWLNYELEESRKALEEMINICMNVKILPVLGQTTPLCDSPAEGGTFIPFGMEEMKIWLKQYRKWLSKFAATHSIPLIDYYKELTMPGTDEGNPDYFFDECHLNLQGNKKMSEVAEFEFKKLLGI